MRITWRSMTLGFVFVLTTGGCFDGWGSWPFGEQPCIDHEFDGSLDDFVDYDEMLNRLRTGQEYVPSCQFGDGRTIGECGDGRTLFITEGASLTPSTFYYDAETRQFIARTTFWDGGNSCNDGYIDYWPVYVDCGEWIETEVICEEPAEDQSADVPVDE